MCGPENYVETEKLNLKCLKHILGVHGRTTNNMLYGELGRFSLEIQIKKKDYWLLGRLIIGKESKLCKVIYDQLLYLFNDGQYKAKWLTTIKSILEECSMAEVWENQTFETVNILKYEYHILFECTNEKVLLNRLKYV